jgi:hypothetical protein
MLLPPPPPPHSVPRGLVPRGVKEKGRNLSGRLERDSPIVKHYSLITILVFLLVSTLPYVVKVKNYF